MSVWSGVILGVIIGWLAEWIIDWIYWRRRTRVINTSAAEQAEFHSQLARLRAESQQLREQLSAANQLNQQQVHATREALQELLQVRAQLSGLQHQSREREVAAGAPPAEAPQPQAPLRQTLLGANTLRLGDAELHSELARLRDELDEQRRARALLRGALRDPLIDINGIGPVYERRLNDAGILTFAELAALTSDRLRAIIQPEKWQQIDPERWIAEAHQLLRRANPDRLIDIHGIGPDYQDRLFDARVYTFAQLAALSVAHLREIIQPEEWQAVDFAGWIAEAARLAARSRQEGS